MWKPFIDKMKSLDERERLKQAEDDIKALKEIVAELQERIGELEKNKNDN